MYVIASGAFNSGFFKRKSGKGSSKSVAAERFSSIFPRIPVLCPAFFMVGSLSGIFFSVLTLAPDGQSAFIDSFLQVYIYGGDAHSLAAVFLFESLFHAAVLFCGFSVLGVFLIPLITACRGFSLSFFAASVVKAFGSCGIPRAVIISGVSVLFSVSGFIVLASLAYSASRRMYGRVFRSGDEYPFGRGFVFGCIACFAVLIIPAAYRFFLLPIISEELIF